MNQQDLSNIHLDVHIFDQKASHPLVASHSQSVEPESSSNYNQSNASSRQTVDENNSKLNSDQINHTKHTENQACQNIRPTPRFGTRNQQVKVPKLPLGQIDSNLQKQQLGDQSSKSSKREQQKSCKNHNFRPNCPLNNHKITKPKVDKVQRGQQNSQDERLSSKENNPCNNREKISQLRQQDQVVSQPRLSEARPLTDRSRMSPPQRQLNNFVNAASKPQKQPSNILKARKVSPGQNSGIAQQLQLNGECDQLQQTRSGSFKRNNKKPYDERKNPLIQDPKPLPVCKNKYSHVVAKVHTGVHRSRKSPSPVRDQANQLYPTTINSVKQQPATMRSSASQDRQHSQQYLQFKQSCENRVKPEVRQSTQSLQDQAESNELLAELINLFNQQNTDIQQCKDLIQQFQNRSKHKLIQSQQKQSYDIVQCLNLLDHISTLPSNLDELSLGKVISDFEKTCQFEQLFDKQTLELYRKIKASFGLILATFQNQKCAQNHPVQSSVKQSNLPSSFTKSQNAEGQEQIFVPESATSNATRVEHSEVNSNRVQRVQMQKAPSLQQLLQGGGSRLLLRSESASLCNFGTVNNDVSHTTHQSNMYRTGPQSLVLANDDQTMSSQQLLQPQPMPKPLSKDQSKQINDTIVRYISAQLQMRKFGTQILQSPEISNCQDLFLKIRPVCGLQQLAETFTNENIHIDDKLDLLFSEAEVSKLLPRETCLSIMSEIQGNQSQSVQQGHDESISSCKSVAESSLQTINEAQEGSNKSEEKQNYKFCTNTLEDQPTCGTGQLEIRESSQETTRNQQQESNSLFTETFNGKFSHTMLTNVYRPLQGFYSKFTSLPESLLEDLRKNEIPILLYNVEYEPVQIQPVNDAHHQKIKDLANRKYKFCGVGQIYIVPM